MVFETEAGRLILSLLCQDPLYICKYKTHFIPFQKQQLNQLHIYSTYTTRRSTRFFRLAGTIIIYSQVRLYLSNTLHLYKALSIYPLITIILLFPFWVNLNQAKAQCSRYNWDIEHFITSILKRMKRLTSGIGSPLYGT